MNTQTIGEKSIRSSAITTLMNVWGLLVGLVLAPFIVHSLGDVQNGYWVIASMIFGYYGFLDFGIGLSIARFLSLSLGAKNKNEYRKIIQTSLTFILCVDVILLVLCLIAHTAVIHFNFAGDMQLLQDLLLIMGLSILVILPGRIFAGILTAHVRQDIIAWIGILNTTLRAAMIFIALSMDLGVRSLGVISGLIALFASLLYYVASRRLMGHSKCRIFAFDFSIFRQLLKYGVSILLVSVGDIIRWGAALLIAGSLFGAAFVTHFNIAISLGRYGVALIASAFAVMMPVFGQLIGTGDDAKIQSVFFRALNLTVMISVFLFGGLIVLGNDFIGNWMGLEYQDSYPALILISCGLMVALMQNPIITLMQGMGLAKLYAVTNGIEALLNVFLCFLLGKYGMIGFGLAFGLPMIAIKLLVQPLVILSRKGWDVKKFYYKMLSRFVWCAIVTMFAAWVLSFINVGGGWLSFSIKGATYVFVCGTISILFIMKNEEKQDVFSKLLYLVPVSFRRMNS